MNPAETLDVSGSPDKAYDMKSQGLSKRSVLYAIIGMVGLLALIHMGFSKTYIKYFPRFEPVFMEGYGVVPFNWIMHFHGMMMMGWTLMLLLQPILIRTGKTRLHRQVGKLSYVLAPLVVVGLYLANMDGYRLTLAAAPKAEAIGSIALTFPGIFFFSTLYLLGMYYKDRPALHMRYLCSTAFLLISPALDRLLMTWFNLPGFDVGCFIVLSLIGAVVLFDSIKTKRLSPFFLVFCFEVFHIILWKSRYTDLWQSVGGAISKIL